MTHAEAITAMKNLPALPEAARMTSRVVPGCEKADPKKVACKVLRIVRTA